MIIVMRNMEASRQAWCWNNIWSLHLIHKHEDEKERKGGGANWKWYGLVKHWSPPQWHTSFNKATPLILPKQFQQIEIKHSTLCAYGGSSHSSHHSSWESRRRWLWEIIKQKRKKPWGLGYQHLLLGSSCLSNTILSASSPANSENILIAFSICFLAPLCLNDNISHLFHVPLYLTLLNVIWRGQNWRTLSVRFSWRWWIFSFSE